MEQIQHKNQSQGEWAKRSFLEQMANIGSEVYRAINWSNKGNPEYSEMAFMRSLELFDLTKRSKLTAAQYKELSRMREIWVDFYYYDNEYNSTEDWINRYFEQLTIAYGNQRG